MNDHLLMIDGENFKCKCGCDIFYESITKGIWICDNCKTTYADETYNGPIGKTCNICIYKEYDYRRNPCLRCAKNAKLERYDKSNIILNEGEFK